MCFSAAATSTLFLEKRGNLMHCHSVTNGKTQGPTQHVWDFLMRFRRPPWKAQHTVTLCTYFNIIIICTPCPVWSSSVNDRWGATTKCSMPCQEKGFFRPLEVMSVTYYLLYHKRGHTLRPPGSFQNPGLPDISLLLFVLVIFLTRCSCSAIQQMWPNSIEKFW